MVEPVYEAGKEMCYKIAVANKKGVKPYGPFIPQPPLFPKGDETRVFLLTKRTPPPSPNPVNAPFRGYSEWDE